MDNEVHRLEHLEGILCPVCGATHKLLNPNDKGWQRPVFNRWDCTCGASGAIQSKGSKILCLQTDEEVENLKRSNKGKKNSNRREVKNRKSIDDERLREVKTGVFRVTIKRKE